MALKYALLASLSRKPQTGYAMAADLEGSIGLFWKATHQQIYKELSQLLADGLLEDKNVRQKEKPDKRVYSITGHGIKELKEWIKEETPLYPTKDALLIKVFVGNLVDQNVIENELKRIKKIYVERLKKYSSIEDKYFSNITKLPNEMKYQFLTLRRGIRFTKAWIAWIEEASDLLLTMK